LKNIVDFCKVHGNGNDFIVIDGRDRQSFEELSRLARLLCRRHFSLGADGLLVVAPTSGGSPDEASAAFHMRIFNADGSEGEMCGNGARAIARWAFEMGIAGRSMTFTTLAGPVSAFVTPPFVDIDMGEVNTSSITTGVASGVARLPYSFLTVGVPHCVILTDGALDVNSVGKAISQDFALFPHGANVSFVLPYSDPHDVTAVTYERGVGVTQSCGTGSVAVAAVVSKLRHAVRVHNPGGVNEVIPRSDGHVLLRGKTAIVATGSVLEDALLEDIQ
jgi:diaminopimelate epimerase